MPGQALTCDDGAWKDESGAEYTEVSCNNDSQSLLLLLSLTLLHYLLPLAVKFTCSLPAQGSSGLNKNYLGYVDCDPSTSNGILRYYVGGVAVSHYVSDVFHTQILSVKTLETGRDNRITIRDRDRTQADLGVRGMKFQQPDVTSNRLHCINGVFVFDPDQKILVRKAAITGVECFPK